MLIAVDIGNTSIKLGLFAADAGGWPVPARIAVVSTRDVDAWQALAALPEDRSRWVVGSVHRDAETQLARWVAHHRPADAYRKLENADLPMESRVEFPERVGTDRLLAAVAAAALRAPARPAIVIDAGTAVKVDLVTADGAFAGGVIWPGWRMMSQSLAGNTDALPLVNAAMAEAPPAIVGTSTDKAIRSGLFWGNVGAVREFVARMTAELGVDPEIFVTGGDAARLAQHACRNPRVVEELVLAGIVITARTLSL
jgi:type III pantothenate kinase